MSAVQLLRPETHPDSTIGRLAEIVRQRSFRSGDFTLASGTRSHRYFNLKSTMMSPEGALLAADAFLDLIGAEGADYVGGLEMGAVPIIGAIAAVSQLRGRPVKTFFVRKAPKAHGTKEEIEGLGPEESLLGKRVLVLDDVATTGGSIMVAIDAARAAGAIVNTGVVLVDREEGAMEALQARGVRLLSLLRGSAFN